MIFSRRAFWAIALGCTSWVSAAEVPVVPSTSPPLAFEWRQEPNPVFGVGESILYVIKYGVVHAGTATMEVRSTETVQGRAAYYVLSEARTNKTIDTFFKVRDKNESWIDRQSLSSLRYRQDMKEGRYLRQVETLYDHPARRYIYRKWRKGRETVYEGPIPPFVQDVLSSLYFIRTRALVVGQTYTLDANSGAETWPLQVHVQKRERIRVPAGTFECLRLEPVLAGEGVFQANGKLEVWVTDDARRIPVLLRSRVAVGAFDAEMRDYRPGASTPVAAPAPPPIDGDSP